MLHGKLQVVECCDTMSRLNMT